MFVTKAIATISSSDADADSPNGTFEAILSTPDLDRDQDMLAQDGWKTPLPARIHIDLDHEMSVAGTVGSAEPFFDTDGNLRIKGTYASTPRAQEVRTLVNEGHISTMSVAFMTDRSAKDGQPNREVLNGAFVAVPSNRGALVLSSKAFEAFEAERKAKKDDYSGPWADPGYLDSEGKPAKDGNGEPRYKIGDEETAKAAWSYINMPKNADQYTASQLTKIKDKIKAACTKFGIEIAEDDKKSIEPVENFGYSTPVADLLAAAVATKAGARNSAADGKMVQAIHDAASLLGAQCISEPAPDADDGSSEGANKSVHAFVVGKSLNGSLEDLGCRIQCALDEISGAGDYGGMYAYVLATFMNTDGNGGSVVYRLGGETLCRAFSDDGSCVALDSNIQAVTLVTSVAAIPDTVDGDPTPLPPAAAEAGKSFDAGGELPEATLKTNTVDAPVPVLTSSEIEDFKTKLDLLTKSSGLLPGSPDSPAAEVDSASPDSKAAPKKGPADESADADDDTETAEDEANEKDDTAKQLRLLRTRLLAADARSAALAS